MNLHVSIPRVSRIETLLSRPGVAPRALRVGALSPAQAAVGLIAAFTALRLLSCALVGLGVDEAYTLAIARHLQLSYFDHPPLHVWIVHALAPILGYGRLARVPFVLIFAGSSWLLFDLTRRLFGERAGLWAVLTLSLSGFFTVAASSWVLPDGPLIFCLLAAAGELSRLAVSARRADAGAAPFEWTWLRIGLWIGLAGLSKYQAVLFGLGVGGYLISTGFGRAWLRRPEPYLAALAAALVVAPVVIWNAQHDWASFAFQGGRAAPSHGVRPAAALSALLGQMALLLPWIFVPLVLAGREAARAGPADSRRWLCVMLSLPGIALFTLAPIWGQTGLPHWSMPAWLFLLPVMGERLARTAEDHKWPRTWAIASFAGLVLIWGLVVSCAASGWVGATWPRTFVKGDPTLELVDWKLSNPALGVSELLSKPGAFAVAMKWNEGGRIAEMLGGRASIVVLSDDPRGFADIYPATSLVGHDALIVVKPEDLTDGLSRIEKCFEQVEPLQVASFGRLGRPELRLHLFAGRRLKAACSQVGRRGGLARRQWAALKAG